MNDPFDFGGHFAQNEKVTNFPMNSRMWQNDERKSYISYILSMKKNRHCCNEQEKTVKTGKIVPHIEDGKIYEIHMYNFVP